MYKVHVEESLENPILLFQLAGLLTIFTVYVLLWHCLRAWWRGSLTQSISIELRSLPATYHTITLCGCKSLHRQPCRLLGLQLPKQLIGRYTNTLCYDRLGIIPCWYQIQRDGDDNPLLLKTALLTFPWYLKQSGLWLHCSMSSSPLLFVLSPLHLFSLHLPESFTPSPMGPSTLIKGALLKGHKHLLGLTSTYPHLLLQLPHSVQFHQPDFHLWCRELFSRDPKAIMQHLRQKQ